jgi:hypothetical protein
MAIAAGSSVKRRAARCLLVISRYAGDVTRGFLVEAITS